MSRCSNVRNCFSRTRSQVNRNYVSFNVTRHIASFDKDEAILLLSTTRVRLLGTVKKYLDIVV
ncbi:MAG: hypothetical protein IJU76_05840, partial [Desulfovibrionaceae bacterium]|nr:hypothetical protein [Desulfovibrionaceae bacterium]